MTPIIFITAYGSDEIADTDLYAEGAVDFIFAPVPAARAAGQGLGRSRTSSSRRRSSPRRRREVQASADQLRLLTDAAPIGIFQTDAENRYVYTNPRWTEITGIPAEEALGRNWDAIVHSAERAGLIAELPDEVVRGDPLGRSFEIQHPGSSQRIVLVTSKSIPDSRGGIGGLGRNPRRRHRRLPRA